MGFQDANDYYQFLKGIFKTYKNIFSPKAITDHFESKSSGYILKTILQFLFFYTVAVLIVSIGILKLNVYWQFIRVVIIFVGISLTNLLINLIALLFIRNYSFKRKILYSIFLAIYYSPIIHLLPIAIFFLYIETEMPWLHYTYLICFLLFQYGYIVFISLRLVKLRFGILVIILSLISVFSFSFVLKSLGEEKLEQSVLFLGDPIFEEFIAASNESKALGDAIAILQNCNALNSMLLNEYNPFVYEKLMEQEAPLKVVQKNLQATEDSLSFRTNKKIYNNFIHLIEMQKDLLVGLSYYYELHLTTKKLSEEYHDYSSKLNNEIKDLNQRIQEYLAKPNAFREEFNPIFKEIQESIDQNLDVSSDRLLFFKQKRSEFMERSEAFNISDKNLIDEKEALQSKIDNYHKLTEQLSTLIEVLNKHLETVINKSNQLGEKLIQTEIEMKNYLDWSKSKMQFIYRIFRISDNFISESSIEIT